jgi:spermidine synthase
MKKKGKMKLKKIFGILARQEVLEKTRSEVNGGLEVVSRGGRCLLNAANTNYSFGGLHRVFQKAFAVTGVSERAVGRALILGFGAGSVASILREELGMQCHITGVEKDPEVLRLGRKYFNTGRFTGIELLTADACTWIHTAEGCWDLVVVDVYEDFAVPPCCETEAFVQALHRRLAAGGMLLFNKLIYNREAREQYGALMDSFRALPGKTGCVSIREGMLNRMIVYEKPGLSGDDENRNKKTV